MNYFQIEIEKLVDKIYVQNIFRHFKFNHSPIGNLVCLFEQMEIIKIMKKAYNIS